MCDRWESSGTGMSGLVDGPQTVAGHVGVDLRRRQVGVAEELLHCPQVGSSLEQVRSVRVPECVGVERCGRRAAGTALEDTPRVTRREHTTTPVEENGVGRAFPWWPAPVALGRARRRARRRPARRSAPAAPWSPCRAPSPARGAGRSRRGGDRSTRRRGARLRRAPRAARGRGGARRGRPDRRRPSRRPARVGGGVEQRVRVVDVRDARQARDAPSARAGSRRGRVRSRRGDGDTAGTSEPRRPCGRSVERGEAARCRGKRDSDATPGDRCRSGRGRHGCTTRRTRRRRARTHHACAGSRR